MKNLLRVATCALCVLIATAIPLPSPETDQGLELVQIPLEGNKELDILSLPENSESQLSERNKRTIGVLRSLFPEISAMTNGDGTASVDMAALTERLQSINRVVRNTAAQTKTTTSTTSSQPASPISSDPNDTNTIATAINDADASSSASDVNESKASGPALDELSLDEEENDENRNKRFLSFGFGGGAGGSGSGGSGNFLFDIIRSTADRAARAAGTIYRVAAGTESIDLNVNKQAVDGDISDDSLDTDNNDSTSRKLTGGLNDEIGLVGGSAGTEQTDEQENAPDGETIIKSADGYTEGIPGPVTRLFVLANRGLANLIQDLILRIAQTSERVVNFKARLITSLI